MSSSTRSRNLLDESLDLDDGGGGGGGGRVVLIEDCVETSGAVVLHHLIKRSLSSRDSDNVIVLLSLAHPFSHYDRILRKMGCNLVLQRDNKRFLHFDMLKWESKDRGAEETIEADFITLYGKIQKALEICNAPDSNRNVIVIIDDISLMEVAANGSSNQVLNFLHYCHSLTTQYGCSFVILNHEDIYSSMDTPTLLLQMEYLADVVIKAEPLATGLATDVHGQLTVVNKGIPEGFPNRRNKICNFHFRIKENNVEYFFPGSRT